MPSERLENYCSRFLLKNYWLLGSKMFSCFFLNKGWLKTFFYFRIWSLLGYNFLPSNVNKCHSQLKISAVQYLSSRWRTCTWVPHRPSQGHCSRLSPSRSDLSWVLHSLHCAAAWTHVVKWRGVTAQTCGGNPVLTHSCRDSLLQSWYW